jgi:HTH-type transcriptional regulator/antitoxin HigA
MSATTFAEVFPVGEHLADELEARGWTQGEFADILGRPAQFVSEIIAGKKEITRESAAQIGAALGTSAEFWLNLQDAYHLWHQAQDARTQMELEDVRLRARLKELAPVSVLLKRGFLKESDPQGQARELQQLYGMQDIHDDPDFVVAARRSNSQDELTATQMAWVACVRAKAASINVEPYSEAGLLDLAQRISRELKDVDRVVSLPAEFAVVGVRLVFVEAFPSSKLDGCSFLMDGAPVIGISGRGKRLDKVLFTLLHEVAHVVLGHLTEGRLILDDPDAHHTLGVEEPADECAGSWILPKPLPPLPERLSVGWVRKSADEQGVHPIVLIGRLQKLGKLTWRTALVKGAPNVTDQLANW